MLRAGWIAAFTAATVLNVGAAWAEPEQKSTAKATGGQTAPSTGPGTGGTAGTQAESGKDPLAADNTDKFQEFVNGEHRTSSATRVEPKVGVVVPEDVKFFVIGPQWNMTGYMYTLMNGKTVIVDRSTRKIVQVVNTSRDTTKAGGTSAR